MNAIQFFDNSPSVRDLLCAIDDDVPDLHIDQLFADSASVLGYVDFAEALDEFADLVF